jgi:ATP-dependent protease ClpP protease subunit
MEDVMSVVSEYVVSETRYRFRFDRDIGHVSEYADLLEFLANNGDVFLELVFSSDGGDMTTALAIINAIHESKVHCHGSLLTHAHSAAGIIFLACSSHSVSMNSTLMIHEQQSCGIGGKASDLSAYVDFETKQHRRLMKRVYEGFLSDAELDQVLNGKEMWMGDSEVVDRLNDMYAYYREGADMPPPPLMS